MGSRDASRRTSVLAAWELDGALAGNGGAAGGISFPGRNRKPVKDGEVKEEKERGVLRATYASFLPIY